MKALIVIDVQNYFAVERAESLPEKIAWHIRESAYDHVIFTRFRNDPDSNFHRLLGFTEATQEPATQLHPALQEFVGEAVIFEKTTYSALKAPGLREYLDTHGVTELDICGVSMDACVLATVYDAFDLGYAVHVLEHLCSVSSDRHDYEDAAKTIITRNLTRRSYRTPRQGTES